MTTVLIVDDSKLARMSIAKALNVIQPDWKRLEASNVDEALAHARAGEVDLALLDFNMPGRDGLSLAAELKAMDPGLPMAVISANLQEEIVSRTEALGASFLAKPLTETALREFLTRTGPRSRGDAQ